MAQFEERYEVCDKSGCWLWTGPINNRGYGRHGNGYAHRLSFETAHGTIPNGREIDHLCGVRRCVNPGHLEAVTHAENINRKPTVRSETHCAHGHEYSAVGYWEESGGRRKCKQCRRQAEGRHAR